MTQKYALYLQDAHDLRDGLDIARYAEKTGRYRPDGCIRGCHGAHQDRLSRHQ